MFQLSNQTKKKLLWMFVFAISMGYLESAVVIYIRDIYYPDGFYFPMTMVTNKHMLTEFLREAATIFMIISIAILTGKKNYEKFGWFLICFGIWDIFYYVFLKLLLNWPESLLTWDILFLIPMAWTGPVLAPVISSILLIFLGVLLVDANQSTEFKINVNEWLLLLTGSTITLVTYVWDYCRFLFQENALGKAISFKFQQVIIISEKYIPQQFPWWIFIIGQVFIVTSIMLFIKRYRLKTH